MIADPAARQTHHAHRDEARQAILGAAGEIFSERGFEAATIKEITDRARVNVASVNYYFRDKLGLYTEVLRGCVHDGRLSLPPEADRLTPEERLTRYIQNLLKALVAGGKPGWSASLMIRELARPTPALPQLIEETMRPNFELLRSLVSDVARHPVEPTTLRLLTHSVLAQCIHWKMSGAIFPHLWPELVFDEDTVRRIAGHVAAFSIAGINAVAAGKTEEGEP